MIKEDSNNIDRRDRSRQRGRMQNDERLVKIETDLAHLEQLADTLNETVIEQGKALRRLTAQVDQLTERAQAEDMKAAKENITKPPHYQ